MLKIILRYSSSWFWFWFLVVVDIYVFFSLSIVYDFLIWYWIATQRRKKKTFINIIVYCNCVIIFPSFFSFIFQFSNRFNLSLKLYCWLFFLLFVFPKIEWWHRLLELLCVRSTCVKRIDWNDMFWWEVGGISYQINQKISWFGIIKFQESLHKYPWFFFYGK